MGAAAHTLAPPRPTGRRYPANVSEFARRLREDGRSYDEVIHALVRRGYRPSKSTVIYWCDPTFRERHNLKQKRRLYPSGKANNVRAADTAWWAKLRRMRKLREAGLSFTAVAAVMNLDFDLELDTEAARAILSDRLKKSTIRKRLEGTP